MICAGDPGKVLWKGDSGGPLTVIENGKHYLAGVASFARCNTQYPTGFAKVSSVIDWIKERMRGIKCFI